MGHGAKVSRKILLRRTLVEIQAKTAEPSVRILAIQSRR